MARVLHTRTEVHQNRVVVQGGIRDQAYREGSPEVESLAGVLACQVALNRNHQGDLTANRETFPIRFFFFSQNAPGGIIPMPRPAGIPRPGPTGNWKGVNTD